LTKEQEDTLKLTQRPEVIDDFIRNYLMSKALVKTLDAFQVGITHNSISYPHLL
jgi:hypothetical protein